MAPLSVGVDLASSRALVSGSTVDVYANKSVDAVGTARLCRPRTRPERRPRRAGHLPSGFRTSATLPIQLVCRPPGRARHRLGRRRRRVTLVGARLATAEASATLGSLTAIEPGTKAAVMIRLGAIATIDVVRRCGSARPARRGLSAGLADVAVVSAGLRGHLDRDSLAQLREADVPRSSD